MVCIASGAYGDAADVLVVAIKDALEVAACGAIIVDVALCGTAAEGDVGIQSEVLTLVGVLLDTIIAVYLNDQLFHVVAVIDDEWTLFSSITLPERCNSADGDIIAWQFKAGAGSEDFAIVTGLLNNERNLIFPIAVAQGNAAI